MSRPNSKKHSGNKIEIKIELTYAFSNRIPVWESGRSVRKGYKAFAVKGGLGALKKAGGFPICPGLLKNMLGRKHRR